VKSATLGPPILTVIISSIECGFGLGCTNCLRGCKAVSFAYLSICRAMATGELHICCRLLALVSFCNSAVPIPMYLAFCFLCGGGTAFATTENLLQIVVGIAVSKVVSTAWLCLHLTSADVIATVGFVRSGG